MKNKSEQISEGIVAFGCLAIAALIGVVMIVGLFLLLRFLIGLV